MAKRQRVPHPVTNPGHQWLIKAQQSIDYELIRVLAHEMRPEGQIGHTYYCFNISGQLR